jgi:hypothetical protein
VGKPEERDHLESLADWIHVVQDRQKWRAVVNTVMKLWVP